MTPGQSEQYAGQGRRPPSVSTYGWALAAVALAVGLRGLLDPLLGDTLPLVTLFGAVAAAVWLGGFRVALPAVILGYLACGYLFIEPRGGLGLNGGRNVVGLLAYFLTCAVIVAFGEALRASRQRLAEQGERLRTTLASIGDAVITTDVQGRITNLNGVAETLTGWNNADAHGQPLDAVFRIVNETTHQPVENPATRALRDGVIVGLANHTVLIARDGTERPIDDSAAPIRCQAGEIVGCVLVFRDISNRKQVELQLHQAEAQLRLMMDALPSLISYVDTNGHYRLNNRAYEEWFQRPRGELTGKHLRDVLGESAWRIIGPYIAAALAGQTVDYEAQVEYKSAGRRWIHATYVPDFDAAGKVAGVVILVSDISIRKEAESRLQVSEQRFRVAIASSPIFVYSCDRNLRYQWSYNNPADFAHLDLIGKRDDEILPAHQVAELVAFKSAVVASGVRSRREIRFDLDHGTEFYDVSAEPVLDNDGTVTGLTVAAIETTDRRRAAALDQQQGAVLEMVAKGEPLRDVLAALCRLIEEQEAGLCCSVLLPEDQERRTGLAVGASLPDEYLQGLVGLRIDPPYIGSCGEALDCGVSVTVPDVAADERYCQPWRELLLSHGLRACRSLPVLGTDGTVLASLAFYRRDAGDPEPANRQLAALATHLASIAIERRRSDDRLRASEALFRTLGEAVPDFLWMADSAGRPLYQNPAWKRYVGMTHQELMDRGWEVIHHPDDVPRLRALWAEAVASGQAFEVEARTRRHDGVYRWFAGRTAPIKDEGGRVTRWVGTMTDVHDRKEAEQALRDADRRKDEFLATLAHELRNPLAPLRTGLQLMKLAQNEPATVEQARSMMERQLAQLVRLIDDLLDLSRVSRGQIELRTQRVDLSLVVQQAVETSRPLVEELGHELALDAPSEPVFVEADTTRLAQVFSNLLNNAAKYTDRGGRIRLSVERRDGEVSVRVKDNGVGIPPHMLPQVFDMFTQVDRSLERSQSGLGIGLSLVKKLVEMHGGDVAVQSDGNGLGSEFTVRLPVASPLPSESGPAAEVSASPAPARRRILVADDNQDAATSLAMLLRLMGHEVCTAHDGLAAVELAETFLPDAALLDIGMPRLNGLEACRRIRQQSWGAHLLLIALTGWGQEDDRRRTSAAGFDQHLVKPVDPAVLEKLLAEAPAATA